MIIPPKSLFGVQFCYAMAKCNNLSRDEMIELFVKTYTVEELSECFVDLMIFNEEQNEPQNQHEKARKDFNKAMEVVWKELDTRHKN